MSIVVTFTVNNRPGYFEQALDSWTNVRGKEDVHFLFSCEPPQNSDSVELATNWIKDNKLSGRVYHNATQLGVLHNPYVALQRAFGRHGTDYAILAEDDLLVSDDILEYHTVAAKRYSSEKSISMVCSFSEYLSDPSLVRSVIQVPNFASVWLWGTWKDRWEEYIKPTWDHDYSTGDEKFPGGWDWNLNKRVLPKLNKYSVQPMVSRVQNIGAIGTHPSVLIQSPVFEFHREQAPWVELGT